MGRKLIVTDSGNYLNLDAILLINPDTIAVHGKEVSRWNIYISLESQPATVTEDRNPKSYKAVQEWIKRNSLLTEQPRGGDGRFQRKNKLPTEEENHE